MRFCPNANWESFSNFITDHCVPQVELLVIVPTILF